MTDKVQKIREEVEKLHNLLPVMDNDNISVNYADRICTTLEMYIDSLQEEPISDFEMALAEMIDKAQKCVVEPWAIAAQWKDELIKLAKTKKGLGEIILEGTNFNKSWYAHPELAFKAGAEWQMTQMMKDATEVTVHVDAGNYPYIPQLELYDYDKDIPLAKEGDKYKVVLIKED